MLLRIATFISGVFSGALQYAYWSGKYPEFSNLSADTPTVYVLVLSIVIWLLLVWIGLYRSKKNVMWVLASAPFALFLPIVFLWIIFSCSLFVYCDF